MDDRKARATWGDLLRKIACILQRLAKQFAAEYWWINAGPRGDVWDARRRVRFVTDIEKLDPSVLRVLQRADATFQRKEGQNETAINAKGFEVDFLRRQPVDDDPHPFRFSEDEDDLWPVQALRASVLTSAPRFAHIVISSTGRTAMMRTISALTLVEFKRWMAAEAPNRPEPKRRRDLRQAGIVQSLLDEALLLPAANTR